jgi:trehalose 6-phosphate phosphatase
MASLPPPPALDDGAALFLDFDGTLIELAERPDAIRVPPALGSLLERLRDRLKGRVAIVSGRAIADLERYLPDAPIAFCGSHGLELGMADGSRLPLDLPPGLGEVRERVHAFAGERHGLLVEEKPAGVALHYRQAPGEASAVADFMASLAREEQLVVQPGNMVVELRPAGANKGDAVRRLMREEPFRGATPFFLGDDLTDEDGFVAAVDLGGAGVLVGAERETAARYLLPSVQAVADWLERQA